MMNTLPRLATFWIVVALFSAATACSAETPSLPGTHWELLSLTSKTEKITGAQNPADVEFLKDGKWGILHYGGRREAGTYQVKDGRLVMKTDDGAVYQDAKMTWKDADRILELDSGDYLMRLRPSKQK